MPDPQRSDGFTTIVVILIVIMAIAASRFIPTPPVGYGAPYYLQPQPTPVVNVDNSDHRVCIIVKDCR